MSEIENRKPMKKTTAGSKAAGKYLHILHKTIAHIPFSGRDTLLPQVNAPLMNRRLSSYGALLPDITTCPDPEQLMSQLMIFQLRDYLSKNKTDHPAPIDIRRARLEAYRILQRPDAGYAHLVREELNTLPADEFEKQLLLYDELLDATPGDTASLREEFKEYVAKLCRNRTFKNTIRDTSTAMTMLYLLEKYSGLLNSAIPDGFFDTLIFSVLNVRTIPALLRTLTPILAGPAISVKTLKETNRVITEAFKLNKQAVPTAIPFESFCNCLTIIFGKFKEKDRPGEAFITILSPISHLNWKERQRYPGLIVPLIMDYMNGDKTGKVLEAFILETDKLGATFDWAGSENPAAATILKQVTSNILNQLLEDNTRSSRIAGSKRLPVQLTWPVLKPLVSSFYFRLAKQEADSERYDTAEQMAANCGAVGCDVPKQLARFYLRLAETHMLKRTGPSERALKLGLESLKLDESAEAYWLLVQVRLVREQISHAFTNLLKFLELWDKQETSGQLAPSYTKLSKQVVEINLKNLVMTTVTTCNPKSPGNLGPLLRQNEPVLRLLPSLKYHYDGKISNSLMDYLTGIASIVLTLQETDDGAAAFIALYLDRLQQSWSLITEQNYRHNLYKSLLFILPEEIRKNGWDIPELKRAFIGLVRTMAEPGTLLPEDQETLEAFLPLFELRFGDPNRANTLAEALFKKLSSTSSCLSDKLKDMIVLEITRLEYFYTGFNMPVEECIAIYQACRHLRECLPYLLTPKSVFHQDKAAHPLNSIAAFAAVHSLFDDRTQTIATTIAELEDIESPETGERILESLHQRVCLILYGERRTDNALLLFSKLSTWTCDATTALLYLEAALAYFSSGASCASVHLENALLYAKGFFMMENSQNAATFKLKLDDHIIVGVTARNMSMDEASFKDMIKTIKIALKKTRLTGQQEELLAQGIFFKNILFKVIGVPSWLYHTVNIMNARTPLGLKEK